MSTGCSGCRRFRPACVLRAMPGERGTVQGHGHRGCLRQMPGGGAVLHDGSGGTLSKLLPSGNREGVLTTLQWYCSQWRGRACPGPFEGVADLDDSIQSHRFLKSKIRGFFVIQVGAGKQRPSMGFQSIKTSLRVLRGKRCPCAVNSLHTITVNEKLRGIA